MKPLVYLDMDGVICDFMYAYELNVHKIQEKNKFFSLVKDYHIFEDLPMMPNAQKLLDLLNKDLDVQVCILSSLGTRNKEISDMSREQKKFWLEQHGITYPTKFVHSWADKKDHAIPNSVMIDDRGDVISTFIDAGGLGVHYVDSQWYDMEYRIRSAVTSIQQRNTHASL